MQRSSDLFRYFSALFLTALTAFLSLPVNSPPPMAMVQVLSRPTPAPFNFYKIYRRVPIASYSSGTIGQVYSQSNFNPPQELRRERYRRTMINRLFLTFDEDGLFCQAFVFRWTKLLFLSFPLVNGQLSRDELYSLSLRLNIFPKFHRFLKQTSTGK
jgi:hypothetical protein